MRNKKRITACAIATVLVFSLGGTAVLAEETPTEPEQEIYESYEGCTNEETVTGYEGNTSSFTDEYDSEFYSDKEANEAVVDEESDALEEGTAREAALEDPAGEETSSEKDAAIATLSVDQDEQEEDEETEAETKVETEAETDDEEETEEMETEAKEDYGMMTFSAVGEVEIDDANFPDSVFREFIEDNYDTNGDGCLDEEEVSAVTELEISDTDIHSLWGIEIFTSLETLTITGLDLDDASIYFTGNTSLKNVLLKDVTIDSGYLNFSECTSLETLYLLFVNTASLNISDCYSLKEVDLIYTEGLESVNIYGASSLEYLYYTDPIILYVNEYSSIPEVGQFIRDDDDNEVWVPNLDVTIISDDGTPQTEPDTQGGTAEGGSTTENGSRTASSSALLDEDSGTADSVATDDSTPIGRTVSVLLLAVFILTAGVVQKLRTVRK